VSDDPRVPDVPLEREIDPEAEREIDPVEGTEMPEHLADAGIEAPEADALEQRLVVPLDDDDR
jgi:hypothetical protein